MLPHRQLGRPERGFRGLGGGRRGEQWSENGNGEGQGNQDQRSAAGPEARYPPTACPAISGRRLGEFDALPTSGYYGVFFR